MKGSNSCIYYLSVFTLFLVLQFQGSIALGTLHVDELTPLTQKYVYIPSFGAEHLVSTTTTASDLKGDFSDGFNVNAVGGISFHAQGDNTVSVPGDINYSSPVSGDISFIGATTDIHSQDDVNIWAASEATFSVQNDLTLQSIVGDFRIQSYLDTEVDGLNGVEIGSLYRETTLSAPNGVLELNTDIIAVSAGDVDEYSSPSISISSNNTVDVRATKVFKIDSNAIDFETVEDLTLQSDVHNAEFETLHQFTATASSNIILKTVSNSYFETLLNDFSVATNGVVSLYAHGSFFYASNIALQGSTIHFDSAGNVKFTDTTGTTVTSNSIGFTANSLAQFKTTTGNIDITATQLNTATDNIFFTASHLPTSPIDVNSSGALKFSTRNSNIEFDSTYIELSSGTNANLVAASDVFLIAVKHTNQPNFVSPDGYSSYTASDKLSVNSQTVNLQSNGGIIFRDEASFTFTGADSLELDAYNLFYLTSTAFVSFSSGNATFTSEKDSTFTADTIEFDFASVNSYAKGKLSVSADASKLSNLNFASTSLSLLSSNDNIYLYGSSLALTISSGLQFENDYEANQEFTVDAAHNLQLTATNNISFKSEASINLMTPTGSIITNANSTQFSGNDGLFETLTDSMFFKDGSFNAAAKNIAIRGRQSITLDASSYNVTMTANTVSVSSGTGVALKSSTLDLTASEFANFEADYTLNLNVENELPFTADKSISVLGGDISFSATDSTFNSGNSFSTSSSKNTLLGVLSTSNITSVLDTTFNFNQISLSTSDYTLTSTGDALFTSTSGDINFSAQSTFSAAVNHTTNFVADNLETNSMGAGFTASIDSFADFTATNAEFTTSNSINLDSAGTFTINGDSFTSTVAAFQFDVGTYDVSGTNTWTSCTGDIVLNAVSYEYTSGNTIPISQEIDPCGTCGTNSSSADQKCAAGNFEIVSRSNRTQTFNTNNVPFVGDVSININGGDLLFQTLTSPGSINFTTDNGVTIKSKNYPNHLTDASDDSLTALAGNLNITITGAAEFVANGYDNNNAYPNYGILMETNYADLYSKNTNYTIKVPTGQIIENAADTIRIATLLPLDNTQATLDPQTPAGFLGQYQDLTVAVTRDVLFDAGVGSITVLSGGSLHQADAKVGAGVEFLAVVGSIDVHADKAQIKFSDKDGFNVTSLYDTVSFTSVLDMTFDSTRQGSTILYQSNFGKMTFNDQLDTSIIAGNSYQDASIAASASDQIYVTSGQSQVYATTGATAAADGSAINIVGEEGGILVEANNNDIDFYSSARVDISAETDTLTFNIQDSILFNADGRIDYRAQTTSSMTVTKGPINFIAGGGGGSVAFASDDGQNIVGQAGKAISISADANGNFDAITGVSYTAQGNINLSNAGVNQDMFYISQGSVNIQADATAGVSFYGKSFHADAFQDVLFDCATFTVDSTSATNTATEPIIEIHAGGDTTVEGLNVFSQGQVQWTTNDGAGVEWLGNKISITVGSDITMTTNGPILLENQGESDDGTFTITSTNGDINIDGEENAVLAGVTSASLNTKGPITYESIGTDPGDGVYIMTRRDLVIDTPEFDMTSDTLDAEINAFSLFATNNIAIENTIGDGGSLSIVSDLSLDLLASGPINMSAQGITTIRSEGDNSDISFEATGNINIQSGGASYFEAQTIYNNAPGTISFATSRGSIDLIASDDTNFIANQTLTFIGKSSLTVSTNDIDSTFLVSSSGDAKFVSVTDFSIESTQGVVSVIGDTLISINNRVPQRSRDQGDIYINSGENIDFESGEDAVYTVGRFYDVTVDTSSYSTNGGDMSFTATYNQANILLTAENSKINIEASSDLSFTVGDSSNTGDLTVSATQDLTWNQLLEDGFGGITISATSSSAPLNIASGDNVSFKAEYSIQGDTKGYLSFKASNAVFASLQSAADVVFQSLKGDVDVQVGDSISYLLNSQNKANEQHQMVIEALASATDSTTQQLYIESRDGTITFFAENNGNIISTSGGYVNYVCADIPEASIECTSGTSVIIESNGVDASNTYGIYFETDDEITFVSTAGLYFNSFHGEAIWNASETFTITSVNFANFESGDDILVYTGYTPAPNAPLDNRIGILFDSSDELLFASYQSDVNFFPRDASWSIDNDIYIRTSGNGGSVSFTSNNNPISATYTFLDMFPTDMLVEAYSLISFDVGGNLIINSGQSMFLYATNIYPSTNSAVNFEASNIIFSTPYGHVNFQPDGTGADQHLVLPPLISQAGISGSYWRNTYDPNYIRSDFTNTEIETNFPGCEERQFGFDTTTEMFCYCDFNKWRCALSQDLGYQTWLNNYYNDPLNTLADPLFL